MKKDTWRPLSPGRRRGGQWVVRRRGRIGAGPLLTRFCGLEQRQAFSTSLAVIPAPVRPVCGGLSVPGWIGSDGSPAPIWIGGTVGGWLGGRWFRGVRVVWLRRAFGLLLLYGGARCLM